jgi:3-hydroxyacyl-CoA dehydrogenase
MKYQIHRAVVIGSGTMGAAIAAHLANVGVRVTLLDIVPDQLTQQEEKKGLTLADPEVRNRIVREGLERATKSRPASFFSQDHASLVSIGNLEDNFDEVAQADWVIEVIIENLKIKRILMERIDAVRAPDTIVSTNTSGIPVASIAEGRSEGFRRHFLGTHFFNPPRYLKLVEVIPTPDTLPGVVEFVSHFLEYRLGKGVVLAKDTPNFIANRLGFGGGAFALDYILKNDYTVEEVDAITGPVIGRPKTATFRLIDLVGVDVWQHVGRNLAPAIPHDLHALHYLESEQANTLIQSMVDEARLGNKTRQGFYKEVRHPDGSKEFWTLNLKTREYEAPSKPRFDSIGKAKDLEKLGERFEVMLSAQDRAGQLVRALTYQTFAYASERIPEIADTPLPIDDAMRWGFNNEAGPFETWDMLGVAETVECMQSEGYPPAEWVGKMLNSGHPTFYQYEGDRKTGVYNPAKKAYERIEASPSVILAAEKPEIARNMSASLRDLGDGVACVEFHTKMNALEDETFDIIIQALDKVEIDFDGLVIGNDAEHFCAGANIFLVVMAAQNEMWDQLDASMRKMQNLNMRMRYFPKPVVMAPVGYALGGGAEIIMHGSRIVAGAELYTGLVEMGQGVIPAGGGTKEMVRRVLNPAMRTQNVEALPFLMRIFEQIGMAKVATSAEEARQLGILGACDRVVLNRSHLLAEAKAEVLRMVKTGFAAPLPEKLYAVGRDGLAALQVGIHMYKEGKYITEHEAVVANNLAKVIAGGDLSRPAWMDEQYFLDLEREAFLSCCGEEKTQQRMWHFLQHGKMLRN